MSVLEIIETLYEGTLDPVAWDRAMLGIADLVRASGAMIFAFHPQTHAVLRDENHRVDPEVVAEYARHWTFHDHRLRHFLPTPVGRPQTEITLGIPDFERSPIYNEFLLRVDMPHFMPVWLHKTGEKAVSLSLLGDSRRGAFAPHDAEMLKRVLPHLARAFEIRDRLEAAEVRASNFGRVLDSTSFGVIVLSGAMRILEANAVASDLLNDRSALYCGRDGALRVRSKGGSRLFEPSGDRSGRAADALIHVPRPGRQPLSVLPIPVPAARTSWVAGDPAWMLLVFDVERQLSMDEQLLARDLGLSQREARVTALLANGLGLSEIAHRMQVTVHTVRSQLKSVFQKTSCHSQTDLVRRVILGPGFASGRRPLE